MAKLPPVKKILREDVKGAGEWVNAIIEPVNSFMESVYQSLNKSLTYGDNLATFIKEVIVRTPSTYPVMDAVEFLSELKFKASGVVVLQAVEKSTYTPVASQVAWVESNGTIRISMFTGLAADKVYVFRLLIS